MPTECNKERRPFQREKGREVVCGFDGGHISSDGGGILLSEYDKQAGILSEFSHCFNDSRDKEQVEHSVLELLKQRVYGLCLGYEDLNDHDELRHDQLLAVMVGKKDPLGKSRKRTGDRGKALAGKSTLNRLELGKAASDKPDRYKKIVWDESKVDEFFISRFVQSYREIPEEIILDFDATDDPVHGDQEGRYFHGYYGHYCYLPLYLFCDDHLLCARLNQADKDPGNSALVELKRVVTSLRKYWPKTRIIVRGDGGFCREELMVWIEAEEGVDYLFGLAKNNRLKEIIHPQLEEMEQLFKETEQPVRTFADFSYQTLKSWAKERRVVAKAEHLSKGSNPRFVVTTLSEQDYDGKTLYEKVYCQRGEMENRIKEQQLCLFADRTSTELLKSNQLRLFFSSVAYTLMRGFREHILKTTTLKKAQCSTIRLKLLKVAARIKITCRKIWISWTEAYPYKPLFQQIVDNLDTFQKNDRFQVALE